MHLRILKAKIHRAVVTHANLDYEGSVTIDTELLDACGILPYEAVSIWNVTRGSRLETYAIEGPRGSGVVCINGAAAHLNEPNDLVIIAAFAQMLPEEARCHVPKVVRVDGRNRPIGDTSPETSRPLCELAPLHLS